MKTKLLLYCTKRTPIHSIIAKLCRIFHKTDFGYIGGKIVAECECEVEEIIHYPFEAPEHPRGYQIAYDTESIDWFALTEFSCASRDELFDYFGRNNGYALHLSNIKAFEKPLDLKDLLKYTQSCYRDNHVTNAPQNMMWVWYNGQRYCLISIRPEWLCKILNGEKPIELRRKILKGMM